MMTLFRFLLRWLFTTNAKDIGTLYLSLGIFSGVIGTFCAHLIVVEANAASGSTGNFDNLDLYNVIIITHGYMMVFFTLIPILVFSFGNWIIPFFASANNKNMAYPKLNYLAFWLLPFALFVLIYGVFVEYGCEKGWMVPSLFGIETRSGAFINFAIYSLHLVGASLLLGAINFIVTILFYRGDEDDEQLTLRKMPLYEWSVLVTAFFLLLSLPVLTGAVTMFVTNSKLSAAVFDAANGGQALYKHILWLFDHSSIYILILPAFGVITATIEGHTQRVLFGRSIIRLAILSIGFLGFVTLVHYMYMFAIGAMVLDTYSALTTKLISTLLFIHVFCWTITLLSSHTVHVEVPVLSAIFGIFFFTVGAIIGALVIYSGYDINSLQKTSYAAASFHYTVAMGAVFAMFSGFYMWVGPVYNRRYNRYLGLYQIVVLFTGSSCVFIPMYILGALGKSRHVPDCPNCEDILGSFFYDLLICVSTIGSNLVWFSSAIVFLTLIILLLDDKTSPYYPHGKDEEDDK